MIRVLRLPVGQLQTNCYLVIEEDKCIIIDPGDDADYIMRKISDEKVKPTIIIATHGHYDHILSATELKLTYQIPFLMHQDDEFLLKKMRSSAAHFGKIAADPPPKVDKYLREGKKIVSGHLSFDIMHTPGHTPGSVSLYSKKGKSVFVGDLIFAGGGVGRVDFAYSNPVDLKKSAKKILKLPRSTKVYPGHGEVTSIAALFTVEYNQIA